MTTKMKTQTKMTNY